MWEKLGREQPRDSEYDQIRLHDGTAEPRVTASVTKRRAPAGDMTLILPTHMMEEPVRDKQEERKSF